MSLISDLAIEVGIKVENRGTTSGRPAIWLRDALLEISSNPDYRDEFDQLHVLGPVFNLTSGTQEYAFSNLLPSGTYNDATLDVFLWTDPGTNKNRIKLTPTDYQYSDIFSQSFTGTPGRWYRFADNIGFLSTPNKAYQVQIRLTQQHPITYNTTTSPPDPSATSILLPQDWNEILVLAAAERGFIEFLEFDRASELHTLLYGDPEHPDKPGLMAGRKHRLKRERWRQESRLRIYKRRYTWGVP